MIGLSTYLALSSVLSSVVSGAPTRQAKPFLFVQDSETHYSVQDTSITFESQESDYVLVPQVSQDSGEDDPSDMSIQTLDTVSASGVVTTWNVLTHSAFPSLRLRLRPMEAKLCDPNVDQYVGYLDVGEDKHFFLWMFESRSKPETDPLVLWLNGGPGCSSMTGLLMELGPCRVNPNGNGTSYNPSSWNNDATVIFLDQPVNVGFSYSTGEGVSDSDSAAADVYGFLQILLTTFPKYATLPFHVTGESYAGHYIPAIGKAIWEGNQQALAKNKNKKRDDDNDIVHVNLESLAIGNGLTDPLNQYEFYADMAEDSKYGPVLDETAVAQMRSKWPTCRNLINACYKYKTAFTCVPGSLYCNSAMIQPFQSTGLNIYDIRMKCDPQENPLCYDIISDIDTYLNQPEVQEALGVDVAFEGCKRDINMNFLFNGDWMKPYVEYIPPLLEDGIRVLIYAGDADFICNWIGNKAWSVALEWEGQEGFANAKDHDWTSKVTGKAAGEFRMFKNFAFLRVFEAGHMVPYDQPEHSWEFIHHWIHGGKNATKFL